MEVVWDGTVHRPLGRYLLITPPPAVPPPVRKYRNELIALLQHHPMTRREIIEEMGTTTEIANRALDALLRSKQVVPAGHQPRRGGEPEVLYAVAH